MIAKDLVNAIRAIINPQDPVLKTVLADSDATDPLDSGAVAVELEKVKGTIDTFTEYYDLAQTQNGYLDILGERLGTERQAGETDSAYYDRIYSRLRGEKLTPYAMRKTIEIFSPNFVLIQEGVGASGYIGRSWINHKEDGYSGYDQNTDVEFTTNVTGLTTSNYTDDTFVVDDNSGLAVGDSFFHNDGTEIRMYNVLQIIDTDKVVIDHRGYLPGESVRTDNVVSISGTGTGTLTEYDPAVVKKCFMGSISAGVLQIRITVEDLPELNDPIVNQFLRDLIDDIKVPGSTYEILKITI